MKLKKKYTSRDEHKKIPKTSDELDKGVNQIHLVIKMFLFFKNCVESLTKLILSRVVINMKPESLQNNSTDQSKIIDFKT